MPGAADALRHLGGQTPGSPVLKKVTEVLAASLTPFERSALGGGSGPVESLVRQAVACRWRLSAACALVPEKGTKPDERAASALVADVDAVLQGLARLAESEPPESKAALDALRAAVTRSAVAFGELLGKANQAAAEKAAAEAAEARQRAPGGARMVGPASPSKRDSSRRSKALIISLGVLAVACAGYWATVLLAKPPPRLTLDGAPESAVVVAAPKGTRGVAPEMVVNPAGKSFDEETLAPLRASAAARGLTVRELTPGTYLLEPSGETPPSQPATGSAP